jgi:hypothetical protein
MCLPALVRRGVGQVVRERRCRARRPDPSGTGEFPRTLLLVYPGFETPPGPIRWSPRARNPIWTLTLVSQGTESHLDPHAGLPGPTATRTFPWVLRGTESHLDPHAGHEGTDLLANANRPARADRQAKGGFGFPLEICRTCPPGVPAPTRPGVWPLGGDVCYLMLVDGTRVIAKRQLHRSVIEVERPRDESQKQVAGVHTHVLDDTPEDTDVFHVLTRKPSVPEMIVTGNFVFVVEADGGIKYLGTAEEVLKK